MTEPSAKVVSIKWASGPAYWRLDSGVAPLVAASIRSATSVTILNRRLQDTHKAIHDLSMLASQRNEGDWLHDMVGDMPASRLTMGDSYCSIRTCSAADEESVNGFSKIVPLKGIMAYETILVELNGGKGFTWTQHTIISITGVSPGVALDKAILGAVIVMMQNLGRGNQRGNQRNVAGIRTAGPVVDYQYVRLQVDSPGPGQLQDRRLKAEVSGLKFKFELDPVWMANLIAPGVAAIEGPGFALVELVRAPIVQRPVVKPSKLNLTIFNLSDLTLEPAAMVGRRDSAEHHIHWKNGPVLAPIQEPMAVPQDFIFTGLRITDTPISVASYVLTTNGSSQDNHGIVLKLDSKRAGRTSFENAVVVFTLPPGGDKGIGVVFNGNFDTHEDSQRTLNDAKSKEMPVIRYEAEAGPYRIIALYDILYEHDIPGKSADPDTYNANLIVHNVKRYPDFGRDSDWTIGEHKLEQV